VIHARILDLPVDTLELTREAVELVGENVDGRWVRVLVARLQALVDAKKYDQAAVLADEISLVAERLGLGGAVREVRTILSRVLEAHQGPGSVEDQLCSVVADVDRDDPLLLRATYQLASLRHRRGDLSAALADFDTGAADAVRTRREWAPWAQVLCLEAGLTAYEIGDWDGALRRLDLGDRPTPEPGRSRHTHSSRHAAHPRSMGLRLAGSTGRVQSCGWPSRGLPAQLGSGRRSVLIAYFDEAELAGVIGGRLLDFTHRDRKHGDQAVAAIGRAIQLRRPRRLRSTALDQLGLAEARILQGEPDEAARLGHQAVDTVEATHSGRVRVKLIELHRHTEAYAPVPSVGDLRERVTTILKTQRP
jgi:hypothetical protein